MIVADVESAQIKTMIVDLAGGEYHLTGRASSLLRGDRPALAQLRAAIDRASGSACGAEVGESRLALCSAGEPLRLVAVGLTAVETRADTEQVLLGTGVVLLDVLALDDGRLRLELVERIRQLSPDVILLLGGTDGAAFAQLISLAEVVALSLSQRILLLYSGSSLAQGAISDILGAKTELYLLPNVHPTPDDSKFGSTRSALQGLNWRQLAVGWPGAAELRLWATTDILPAPQALTLAAMMIAPTSSLLVVDLGSSSTNLVSVRHGRAVTTTSPVGIGQEMINLIPWILRPEVQERLSSSVSLRDLLDYIGNSQLELHIQLEQGTCSPFWQTVVREAISLALQEHLQVAPSQLAKPARGAEHWWDILAPGAPPGVWPSKLVATGGAFSLMSSQTQVMQVLLDGVQPEGVTELAIDHTAFWPQLGALSVHLPKVAEAMLNESLQTLCTVIRPIGSTGSGRKVLTAKFVLASGAKLQREINFGQVSRLPETREQLVEVELIPERSFDLGAGPGEKIMQRVSGGSQGVLLDGRGSRSRRPYPEFRAGVRRD